MLRSSENSFRYVTQAQYQGSVPDLHARYTISYNRTHFPSAWHEQAPIPCAQADLLALKDSPRQGGPLLW